MFYPMQSTWRKNKEFGIEVKSCVLWLCLLFLPFECAWLVIHMNIHYYQWVMELPVVDHLELSRSSGGCCCWAVMTVNIWPQHSGASVSCSSAQQLHLCASQHSLPAWSSWMESSSLTFLDQPTFLKCPPHTPPQHRLGLAKPFSPSKPWHKP